MDNLFEILIPLIFAAVYFFGHLFNKKSDDESSPLSREMEDPEAAERQRRTQEEIRRKIMERRQAEEGGRARSHQPESVADRNLRERRAAVEQRRQPSQPAASRLPESGSRRSSPDSRRVEGSASRGSIPHLSPLSELRRTSPAGDVYGNEMAARLKKIEATKREAERLKQQAAAGRRSASPVSAGSSGSSGRSRETWRPVRASLRDPAAARRAFIHSEILGPPVSQRKAQ
ncbi:MAG: hypothetical protein EA353_01485 [Puniceicoccaceae bacterium]|nr:MAG: hypothetical protein EA353_01485 [Puniceicoccaceae bacterium]